MLVFARIGFGTPVFLIRRDGPEPIGRTIRSASNLPLKVITTTNGGAAEEAAFAERFARVRLSGGDSYIPTAELLESIRVTPCDTLRRLYSDDLWVGWMTRMLNPDGCATIQDVRAALAAGWPAPKRKVPPHLRRKRRAVGG